MKTFLNVLLASFLTAGVSHANPLKKYFAGRCGLVNSERESSVQQACYASVAKSSDLYFVVFTNTAVFEYRFEKIALNEEKTQAIGLLKDDANQTTSIIKMDWFYSIPTYPGESIESYPLTLVGFTPAGQKFNFSELKEFYNGHSK